MREETQELLKKFEQDHEIYVSATDALTYWIVYARILTGKKEGFHNLHAGKKYVSGPNEGGNVLILPDPSNSDAYEAESWGEMETIDDFVKKALDHILSDENATENEQSQGCGTGCI